MAAFRRLSQRTKESAPKVASTTIAELSTLAALPDSVRSRLGTDEQLFCVVKVESSTRRYTLLLDLEWVSMAVEVDEHQGDLTDGLPLPRAAIRAVMNGWSTDQPFDEPAIRWSADDIPHIGFSASDHSNIS